MKKLIVAIMAVAMTTASVSLARDHAGPHHGGGWDHGHNGNHGGPYNDGNNSTKGDYGDGVLAGLLLSTSALFLTHVTADHSEAVYLYADNDAAEYLANDGQQAPSPALAQAMNYERNFLASADVANASDLSDTQVAYLVMKRAESL
jgi:hypothetical protein